MDHGLRFAFSAAWAALVRRYRSWSVTRKRRSFWDLQYFVVENILVPGPVTTLLFKGPLHVCRQTLFKFFMSRPGRSYASRQHQFCGPCRTRIKQDCHLRTIGACCPEVPIELTLLARQHPQKRQRAASHLHHRPRRHGSYLAIAKQAE